MFKIMYDRQMKNRHPEWPDKIPMEFVKQYQKRIEYNHSQTPERLNERGGLSPLELHGAINDMSITEMLHDPIDEEDAMYFILEELESYQRNGGVDAELRQSA